MEKIWLSHYKPGIPTGLEIEYTTLVDLFAEACNKFPDHRSITCHGVSFTYDEVRQKVIQFANGLQSLGVEKGDRVALVLPNSLQYPIAHFAILALGAVVVNVNPLYTVDEMEYILQDSTPKVVICFDMFAEKLNNAVKKSQTEHVVMTHFADPYPFFKRKVINGFLRYIAKVNPKLSYKPIMWRDLFSMPIKTTSFARINHEDLAFIQYTGATTGRPKGAMLTHANMVANVRQVSAVIEAQVKDWSIQISMNALPLYHIFSLHSNLYVPFFHGAESVMVPNARNIKSLVRLMNKTPFTIFNSLDSLYHKLLETPAFTKLDHSGYKYGICGGMPLRDSVAKRWQDLTGVIPANCYGMTEACPCISMSYFDQEYNGSAGYPAPSTDVEIRRLEDQSKICESGEAGVIYLRGPQFTKGYWKNPEATAKAFDADGWLISGDVGYFNESAQLVVSGRTSEMIIVSGFNVYPAEVERVIDVLTDVKEVAVVGLPNNDTGECVQAFVVLRENSMLTPEQIIIHSRKLLSKYKAPRRVYIIDELPKTLVGKVDKKLLVQNVLSGRG